MGYLLLWVENLAVSLLAVATLVALICHRSQRPAWKWVHHVAPPIILLLLAVAGFWAWSTIAMDHFLERSDPFALALLWLVVVGLTWLLFPLWSQRAAIKVSLKHGFRSWGSPVLALLVIYAGVGSLALIIETAGFPSEALLYLLLAVTVALTVSLIWLLMRKTRPWAKAGLPLVAVALPPFVVLSLEESIAYWFLPTLIFTTFVAVLSLWILRGDMARGLRIALVGLAILPIMGVYVAATWVAGKMEAVHSVPGVWFHALCLLTILFVIGAIWTASIGFRRRETESVEMRAARWPRGRLSVALAVAVVLHLMTYWNLDLGVRQRLAPLRVEASSLALSLAPVRLPNRENAAAVYYQAFDAMNHPTQNMLRESKWFEWQADTEAPFDPHDVELRQYLKVQAPALALFREAAKRPGCCFDHDYSRPSYSMLLPEAQEMRTGAQLLATDARCKAADGDLHGALENVNTMFAMAEHAAADPLTVVMLNTAGIDHRAMLTLQIVLAAGKPTPEDLMSVRVSGDLSYHRLLKRIFRMEEAIGLAFFCDIGTGRGELQDLTGPPEIDDWVSSVVRRIKIHRVFFLDADLAAYREFMEKSHNPIGLVSSNEAKKLWIQLDLNTAKKKPGGIVTHLIVPLGDLLIEAAARADARRGLARLALAACRYRAQHDRLPEDLDDLVPEFITLVPRDPFDGKPLKQTTTDDGTLILYSIGPDLVDDGGTPFDGHDQTGDLTFELPSQNTANE